MVSRLICTLGSKLNVLGLATVLCLSFSLTRAQNAEAETVQWQGLDIHYTTFSSMLIPQEVAAMHNIVRAKNRIVTNVSIVKDGEPQAAEVTGLNTNLLNQLYTMDFLEVTETNAIYYLANQLIDERDTLRFDISITPKGMDKTYQLKFMRQY